MVILVLNGHSNRLSDSGLRFIVEQHPLSPLKSLKLTTRHLFLANQRLRKWEGLVVFAE